MSVSDEPSELTPLRRNVQQQSPVSQQSTSSSSACEFATTVYIPSNLNNNNNNIIISNSGAIDWQRQSHINNNKMTDTNRAVLARIGIDICVMLAVGLPILAFFLWGDPYKRGFFCDDESLMHPFHDSTIRNWMLYIIGLILPLGVILSTEVIQSKLNKVPAKAKIIICGFRVPTWLENSYDQLLTFAFGSVVSQLTVDIAKYSIGRLRPHFFSVCQPIMPDGTNCSNPANLGRYIEEFTCLGVGSSARMLKEVRLSFPSGHSSYTAFTMVYCVIYLQSRMTWRRSKLIKHFLQFALILITWFTALSRISDYKHHWSDVLAGGVIGVVCAVVVANFVADLRLRLYKQNGVDTAPATNGTRNV